MSRETGRSRSQSDGTRKDSEPAFERETGQRYFLQSAPRAGNKARAETQLNEMTLRIAADLVMQTARSRARAVQGHETDSCGAGHGPSVVDGTAAASPGARRQAKRAAHAPSLATQSARLTLRGKNTATKIENNSKIFDALSVVKENH
jgi:hypothetical protein